MNIKVSPYDFRGEKKADIPRVNSTRYGLRSFRSEAPRIWNRLPNNLHVAEWYPQFRRLIQRWDGFGCQCPLCNSYFCFSSDFPQFLFENFTIIIFILHVYYPMFFFNITGAFFLEHFTLSYLGWGRES